MRVYRWVILISLAVLTVILLATAVYAMQSPTPPSTTSQNSKSGASSHAIHNFLVYSETLGQTTPQFILLIEIEALAPTETINPNLQFPYLQATKPRFFIANNVYTYDTRNTTTLRFYQPSPLAIQLPTPPAPTSNTALFLSDK